MRNERDPEDVGALWRAQPERGTPPFSERFLERRARALSAATRSEILTSIGSAVLFIAVLAWRVELRTDPVVIAGGAVMLGWILVTFYRFRNQIWPGDRDAQNFGLSGIEFYKAELARRRRHVRSMWLWSGPPILSCSILAGVLRRASNAHAFYRVLPFLSLLIVWIVVSIWRRRRLASEIQKELDEIGDL